MKSLEGDRKTLFHRPLTWVFAVVYLLVLALPFALRTRDAGPSADAQGAALPIQELVLISPHWEGIREEFGRAFSEWTTENYGHRTNLEWLDVGGTSDAVRYVRSEFKRSPEGIGIDLFFGGGVDPFLQLAKEGLLSPCSVQEEILRAIPKEFAGIEVYDAQGHWYGACLAGFGIIYNKPVLQYLRLPEPQTWEDLAKPDYCTWVGSGDPRVLLKPCPISGLRADVRAHRSADRCGPMDREEHAGRLQSGASGRARELQAQAAPTPQGRPLAVPAPAA